MLWCTLVLIYATVASTYASSDKDSLLVRTTSGEVRGYRDPDGDIFAFYEIPYATVPTGPNRFKAPLPPPVWLKPLDAVDTGIICPQVAIPGVRIRNDTMQENCLVVNIFVPDTDDKNLPVLVIVHGGAFQMGYGNLFLAKNLIRTEKLIVVSFNYRLGVHGFLCLGTKDIPGNAGMKDQVALLRWVNRNIASFGGNLNDVTILGYSSGSASVDLLLLSKSAKGLFNKVIAKSGSHLSAFTMQRDPLQNAKYFAKRIDATINFDDVYALEALYKSTPYEQLMIDNFLDRTDSTFLFSPCVERESGEDTFLDDDPVNIIKNGDFPKVPLLYGFTNMEGLMRIEFFESWKTKMNEIFSLFLPADLHFQSDSERLNVAKAIKIFYFGDKTLSNEYVYIYIYIYVCIYVYYFTDVLFAYSTLKSIRMQVEGGHNKIYLYEYSFVDDSDPVVPHTDVRGAKHGDQTRALFDGITLFVRNASTISEEFKKMKSVIRELWSNFIITGTPVPEGSSLPEWPPVGADWSPHMSLSKTVELKGSLLEERARFWNTIYDKYYRPAFPPPAPLSKHIEL